MNVNDVVQDYLIKTLGSLTLQGIQQQAQLTVATEELNSLKAQLPKDETKVPADKLRNHK